MKRKSGILLFLVTTLLALSLAYWMGKFSVGQTVEPSTPEPSAKIRDKTIEVRTSKGPVPPRDYFEDPPIGITMGYDPRRVNPLAETPEQSRARLDAELEWILKLGSASARVGALAMLIGNLNRDFGLVHGKAIEGFLEGNMADPDKTNLLRNLACETAFQNPGLILRLIPDAPAPRRHALINEALAKFSPEMIESWFRDLLSKEDGRRDVLEVSSRLADSSSGANLTEVAVRGLITDLPDSPIRNALAQRLGAIAPLPTDLSFATVSAGVPEELVMRYAKKIYRRIQDERPEAYQEILMEAGVPAEIKNEVATAAVSHQMRGQASINELLGKAPELAGEAADIYWHAFGDYWLRRDAILARNTIKELPGGRPRDILLTEVVRNSAGTEPDSAMQCAELISDQQLRDQALAILPETTKAKR